LAEGQGEGDEGEGRSEEAEGLVKGAMPSDVDGGVAVRNGERDEAVVSLEMVPDGGNFHVKAAASDLPVGIVAEVEDQVAG
jgi:hypothetical protein